MDVIANHFNTMNATTLVVSWQPPSSAGTGPITYSVNCTNGNTGALGVTNSTTYTFFGVMAGNNYTISVAAKTDAELSSPVLIAYVIPAIFYWIDVSLYTVSVTEGNIAKLRIGVDPPLSKSASVTLTSFGGNASSGM